MCTFALTFLSEMIWYNIKPQKDIGPVHKRANHVPKAVSDHDPHPDWVCDLNYTRAFTSIGTAVSITNRICALRGNILFLLRRLAHAWLQRAFPKCACTNHCSERALHSQVLRIRLSRRIMIQNAPFSKAWFERALHSQRVKSCFSNQERVRITIQNGFRNVIRSFVNRPHCLRPKKKWLCCPHPTKIWKLGRSVDFFFPWESWVFQYIFKSF